MRMTLTSRLILGSARLTGGASEGEALALVRAALDAGVGQVDTAPSYGMGTAEQVVGKALVRFGGPVRVTAKLGSARDPNSYGKSMLRRMKRALGGSRTAPWDQHEAPPAQLNAGSGNDFSPAFLHTSLAASHDRLGRIDHLLLHDIAASEVTPPLLADLAGLARSVSATPGYASRAQWDSGLDARFAPGTTVQCAMAPQWFADGPLPALDGPLFLHSVIKAGALLRARSPRFSEGLDRAARVVGSGDSDADRIAALYAIAGSRAPHARLIIASSHRERLLAVLGAIARIDHSASAAEIAACFQAG
jgi:hypothetical protein